MTHEFDERYWERHWQESPDTGGRAGVVAPPNPYLVTETAGLAPGTALEAGCGTGAEAIWLASRGWRVTAADISAAALARAAAAAADVDRPLDLEWLQADLSTWEPATRFDLVTTHYAHPSIPQLAFYERLSTWVAPSGTLLVVGHRYTEGHRHTGGQGHAEGHRHDDVHDDEPPAEATVSVADVTATLDESRWDVVTAAEHARAVTSPDGHRMQLHDVVVRAARRR